MRAAPTGFAVGVLTGLFLWSPWGQSRGVDLENLLPLVSSDAMRASGQLGGSARRGARGPPGSC